MLGNMTASKTTQNVLAASGGLGASLLAIVTFIRTALPDVLPWPVDYDGHIIVVIVSVLAPVVSRIIALWRDPDKPARREAAEVIADALSTVTPEQLADAARSAGEIVRVIRKRKPAPETDPELRRAKWIALKDTLAKAAAEARARKGE